MHDPGPLLLRGTPVSPGLARGPLALLGQARPVPAGRRGDAAEEAARLRRAIARATEQLARLAECADDPDSGLLVAFQVEMLGDPVVTTPAFEAIARGAGAESAWGEAMELQVRVYRDADDPYFHARAADICDMRERVHRHLLGEEAPAPIIEGSIVVGTDLAPSRFLEIRWEGGGIALTAGSPNSHVAMLARSRGIPMLIGLEHSDLARHSEALLDSDSGILVASPDAGRLSQFASRRAVAQAARADEAQYLERPAAMADGGRVQVLVNIAGPDDLAGLEPSCCDGIGLVRTELLVGHSQLEDEEAQYAAYRRIVQWAKGRPVTIRTLDAGGDKPIAGYTVDNESNPFLGVRGVRLSLAHPKVFACQLRALARAAALGPLKVMVPMVTVPRELEEVRKMLVAAVEGLAEAGVDCAMPELGMMVEVPAAALCVDLFAADFLSIGSNDLVQYLTACGRDSAQLAALQDPLQPAVLRLIREVVEGVHARAVPVSLCGDMASDPRFVGALLDAGLRSLSVAPAAIARVKRAIAGHRPAPARGR